MDKLGQEWVSAAVDGELDEQVLAELAADADSHEQWRDYHMIGDAMRGELPQTVSIDLSANIMAAIDDEPAMVAPKSSTVKSKPATNNVVALFKQFGQYAIAASVAMVAVVGVQNYNQASLVDDSPLPVLNTRPLIGSVSPVSMQTGAIQSNQSYTSEQVVDQRRRINAYIQDHMLQQRLNNGAIEGNKDVVPVPAKQQ
ncbi:sigma-E factor negative regulatory protein [Shewanella youngdeokensis]|uniref:Anti-sigma-E factor RseA n=1 Tax=Shewanella youngdeokensis TaxID=2999068 RepID=A0ABZ0JVR5_9GAMM|nr:RseA family anti-sigma factor [Shewanella sp. DAU334]